MSLKVKPKVALIHYWLNNWRGGELVLKDVADLLGKNYEVHIYTHVLDHSLIQHFDKRVVFHTTFIDKLPFSNKLYQAYILLMPIALKLLKLDDYESIISFESGPSKGIRRKYNHKHICYVHSPMRYIWDMHEEYLESSTIIEKIFLKFITPFLRIWDKKTSHYPKKILCNSKFVKKRIKKYWGRDAIVVYPGITPMTVGKQINENFYLYIGELNHYKKADIVFEAFKKNGRKLKIIGKGPFLENFKKDSQSNIELLGRVSDQEKFKILSECVALIFPSKEDFGLVPIEAMMHGKPVIAYQEGGATETVINELSGLFFNEQNSKSLNDCILKFEKMDFKPKNIIKYAQKFSNDSFKMSFSEHLNKL